MPKSGRFLIVLNGQEFAVAQPVVEGLQVRVLGKLDDQYELILEGSGEQPDKLIKDTDRIDLTQGPVRLFAKPQTAFG